VKNQHPKKKRSGRNCSEVDLQMKMTNTAKERERERETHTHTHTQQQQQQTNKGKEERRTPEENTRRNFLATGTWATVEQRLVTGPTLAGDHAYNTKTKQLAQSYGLDSS
jgi:hypothetical protein